MKKTILYAAAFVAAVASCNKPEIDAPVAEEKVWVEFTTGAMTKVTREDVEGDADIKHKFVWEENDAITVNGETFTTTESGDKVTFGAEVPVNFLNATSFEAIYPASAGESFDAITVPATYETVPESGFYGIVAVAASENQSFQFKHATSFVKFQVPTAVSNVTISADEDLAGVVSVAMTEGAAVVTIEDGVNAVTLSGEFVTGKDYYVPVLAGKKTNLTVSFDGKASKEWASVTLNQGRVANMGALPQPKVERGLNFSSSTATATYGQSFTAPTLLGVTEGVTYTSSNTSVATVDASTGKVTLVAGGTTTITASASENNTHLAGSASYDLTVNKAARNLKFSEISVTGKIEQSFTAPTLTGVKDGVTYKSSDTSVATVDASTGKVNLVAGGTTTITASAPATSTHESATISYDLKVIAPSDWRLVGKFNGKDKWSISDGSIPMYATGATNTYVAENVTLTADDIWKFKFKDSWEKSDGGWVGSHSNSNSDSEVYKSMQNHGANNKYGSNHSYDNKKSNFGAAAGTYDIYLTVGSQYGAAQVWVEKK